MNKSKPRQQRGEGIIVTETKLFGLPRVRLVGDEPPMKLALVFCWLMMFTVPMLAAERSFSGAVQEGGHVAAFHFGEYGSWLVSTAQRWEGLKKEMESFKVKFEDALGAVDFAKEDLAVVFHYGDEGDKTALLGVSGDEKSRDVKFAMSYIIYKQRRGLTLGVWSVLAVPVQKSAKTGLSVVTYHPMNGGPHPTADKGRLEYAWTFEEGRGEGIGGLTAKIEAKGQTIKAGDDIVITMTLSMDDAAKEKHGSFARAPEKVYVWDGKYSNGYRNYAFEVMTPDGKQVWLRPAVTDRWDKNAPHPVEISAGKSYVLPNWVEGQVGKSLQGLGLDTSSRGVYLVRGVYLQTGEAMQNKNPGMWGGMVGSNVIRVEVR